MSKVLIVEDDNFLGKVYWAKLKDSNIESFHMTVGAGVIDKVKEYKPDVIILDLIMPGISGIDVLKELKQDNLTKNISVIVVTNMSGDEDMKKCLNLGASKFIVKSDLSFSDVVETIRPYLNSH